MTFMSYDIHVETCDGSVEVGANHLLAVASHHALTWCEVFWCEDRWCHDEWNVWCVDVACLEVAAALVADEDLVTNEVRILVDCEAVAECTDRLCTDGEWRTNLSFAVHGELWLIEHRSLEDRCNVWTANEEVCRAAEGLTMDGVGDIDDCLDEGLVPFTDRTGEGWADGEGRCEGDRCACCLVDELAWSARPVVVGAVSSCHEVVEDLAVDFESNLLGENRGELDLGIHRVVCIEVLCELWRPLGTELAGLCSDRD